MDGDLVARAFKGSVARFCLCGCFGRSYMFENTRQFGRIRPLAIAQSLLHLLDYRPVSWNIVASVQHEDDVFKVCDIV